MPIPASKGEPSFSNAVSTGRSKLSVSVENQYPYRVPISSWTPQKPLRHGLQSERKDGPRLSELSRKSASLRRLSSVAKLSLKITHHLGNGLALALGRRKELVPTGDVLRNEEASNRKELGCRTSRQNQWPQNLLIITWLLMASLPRATKLQKS